MLLRSIRFGLMVVLLGMVIFVAFVAAAERGYRQVVNGVAIYFGIVPAELVRGHPPQHPEGQMHGGVPVGENHIMVALFHAQSGARLTEAEVHATITGPSRYTAEKRLEPMVIAGSLTYGNDSYMTGPGPYRIVLRIRLPGETRGTARELHLGAVVNKRKPEASASQGRKQTQARHMARPAVHDWSRAQGLKPGSGSRHPFGGRGENRASARMPCKLRATADRARKARRRALKVAGSRPPDRGMVGRDSPPGPDAMNLKLILALLLAGLVALFAIQNAGAVELRFLF